MRAAGTCPRRPQATCRPVPARSLPGACAAVPRQARGGRGSRTLREFAEVGAALLAVRVAALLRLLRPVEQEVRVVRQLLQPGQPVLVGVEARLEQAQREGGELEHLA